MTHRGAGDQRCDLIERLPFRHLAAAQAAAHVFAAPPLGPAPHGSTTSTPRSRGPAGHREPMRLRPQLVGAGASRGGARRGQPVGARRTPGNRRTIETEVDLRLRLVSERAARSGCGCGEWHGIATPRRAGHRRTARPAARGCSRCRSRDGCRAPLRAIRCGAHEALAVDGRIVAPLADPAAETRPCRTRFSGRCTGLASACEATGMTSSMPGEAAQAAHRVPPPPRSDALRAGGAGRRRPPACDERHRRGRRS